MRRDEFWDLSAFLAVAEERSFTRAAAKLHTSQSVLSQTVRRLEAKIGVQLLIRTTRSVTPTEAGEQLCNGLRPAFNDIRASWLAVSRFPRKTGGHHSDHGWRSCR